MCMALSNYAARIDRTELCIEEEVENAWWKKIHAFPFHSSA